MQLLGRTLRSSKNHSFNSPNNSNFFHSHRSGALIAGVFILGLAATASAITNPADQQPINKPTVSTDSKNSQPQSDKATGQPSEAVTDTSATTTTSISSQSQPDGSVNTSVTVNGQPVEVPQDVQTDTNSNSNGSTSLNISSTQTNSGTTGHSYSYSNLYTRSSSNSNVRSSQP